MPDLTGIFGGPFDPSRYKSAAVSSPFDRELDLRQEMASFGLVLNGPLQADGVIHRLDDADKKPKNKNGWYVLFHEERFSAGAYGSWSRPTGHVTWCSRRENELTPIDREAMAKIKAKAKRLAEEQHALAAETASVLAEVAVPAPPDHPYLVAKHIKPHGAKVYGRNLFIPATDIDGNIKTYQTIPPEPGGKKLFQKNGEASGAMHIFGQPTSPIYVCEGWATAATIHEHTGKCVYAAFSRGNLGLVIDAIRQRTQAPIVICADNDQWTEGNPGLSTAQKVAQVNRDVEVRYPIFASPEGQPTDFNDLFVREGQTVLLNQITAKLVRPLIATALGLLDPAAIPKRQFLYGQHLIRRYCSATISPGGVGKTQLAMTDAIAVASGRRLLYDQPWEDAQPSWHYNLEDPLDELQRRVAAICLNYQIPFESIAKTLHLNSGRDRPLILVEKLPSGGSFARPDADALYRALRESGCASLSVDPFVRSHYVDENSNKEMDEVVKIFGQIANDANCAIDLVHHVTKASANGEPGDLNAARGASSLGGAVRAARTLTVMSSDEAKTMELSESERHWYLRVDNAKANLAPPASGAKWLHRISVVLPNGRSNLDVGDNVGVLEVWESPSIFSTLTYDQIVQVLDRVKEADASAEPFMKGQQSKKWAGLPLLDVGLSAEEAKQVISAWLRSGLFEVKTFTNSKGRDVHGISVNDSKRPSPPSS